MTILSFSLLCAINEIVFERLFFSYSCLFLFFNYFFHNVRCVLFLPWRDYFTLWVRLRYKEWVYTTYHMYVTHDVTIVENVNNTLYYEVKSTHVFFLVLVHSNHNINTTALILVLHGTHSWSSLTHNTIITMNTRNIKRQLTHDWPTW